MIALGVTGTDTGVGKTVVACALAAAYVSRGARVGVMKPVETGVTPADMERDGLRLAAAAASKDDPALITPYLFPEPLAPMIAARRAKGDVDLGKLDGAFSRVSRNRDVVIVEGAGGLLVPLDADLAFDALFARWELGVVIVAGNRLGVINHARLTVQAARAAELPVRALVLNDLDPRGADASSSSNESVLREVLPDVRVIRFPWMPQVGDHQALALAADRSGLIAAVAGAPAS